jgi:GNAT superfamily N-acetyltransferase
MQVRRAVGRSDAGAAAAVYLRSRAAAGAAMPPLVHTEDEVRAWLAGLVDQGRTWVVDLDEQVAGMAVLQVGWIDQLYVDPDHQGRGLGSLLVDRAKALSPDGLDLWTFVTNERARAFYAERGFVVVDTSDDNEEGAPALRLHWCAWDGSRR